MRFFGSLTSIFSKAGDEPPRHADRSPVTARMAEASHQGARQNNEDCVLIAPDIDLALVADGMGGHEAGEEASRLAVDIIHNTLAASRPLDLREAEKAVVAAVIAANAAIHTANQARSASGHMAMGTTVAGAWRPDRDARQVIVFNVGDSRAYLFRAGRLSLLSRDHTLYQNWLDDGERGPAPAPHYLTRCIGTAAEVEPAVGLCHIAPGDILLLCSDGLNAHVDDTEIGAALGGASDADTICRDLVERALAGGGSDNVSVAMMQWCLGAVGHMGMENASG
jgi:serine/threonine protein phosphatase PrpC